MSRAERLLQLLQILRRHYRPASGHLLAAELGVSLRTLYRDIASLQAQGAPIEGEAGIGYILRPGFLLPPLMFSDEEIEALVLGSTWVARSTDARLGAAAEAALAKIGAVLPPDLRAALEGSSLLVPTRHAPPNEIDLALVRTAIRTERKLGLGYADASGAVTDRVVWPFALGFFERTRVIAAWCELRGDFRHFRTDRIARLDPRPERYPRRRRSLLGEWRRLQEKEHAARI
ncbi:MAG: YafY family protein [Amaricoccus sp.]